MAQTKPKAGQFYGVSNNGTDGQFLKTDGTGGMSWDSPITNPTITSIDYPGTATAADPAGGESVIINGTLFASGVTCTVGGTSAVTAFNSANQITITTPAKAAGQYTVAVTNPDGGTVSQANFIQYSGVPVWSTASGSLGSVQEGATASFQVTATEGSDTIEYAVTTGTLPTGLSLATATGAITGTAGSVSADTTSTFSITATDDENQTSSARSFSITVTNVAPSEQYNAKLFTGRSQNVTGFGFDIDLAWVFNRTAANGNFINDTVRGATETLWPTDINAEDTRNVVTSFITGGVTIGDYGSIGTGNNIVYGFKAGGTPTATNSAGVGNAPTAGSVMVNGVSSTTSLAGTIAAKKISVNTNLGLSIVQYTGTGSAATIAHELGGVPDFIIIKNLDTTDNWRVYNSYSGATKYMNLNDSNGTGTASTIWNDTTPTSTVFSVGSDSSVSGNGNSFIAYLFKNTAGFTKSGGYTGNGSTNGPFVETGFKPAYLILKSTSNSGTSWKLMDSTRNPSNPVDKQSDIQDSIAESTSNGVNFYENGFQLITTDSSLNGSGYTYTYLAIAGDGSTTTPSLANSFEAKTYTGNGGTQEIDLSNGMKPDLIWMKRRNTSQEHALVDSVRGVLQELNSDTNAADLTTTNGVTSFDDNGWTMGANGLMNSGSDTYVSWNWKAGGTPSINTDGSITSVVSANQAAGFSIVNYTGNGTVGATIGHGLGSKPELFFIKQLNASRDWIAWCNENNTEIGYLNHTDAFENSRYSWALNSTQPTSTTITFSNDASTNGSSNEYIVYCFKSITGYSKIGKYTGNGNASGPTESLGFAPKFLMIKSIDSAESWIMYDSARNTSNPRTCHLRANTNAADYCSATDAVDFNSTDFQVISTWDAVNKLNDEYIYLAIG